MPKILVADPIGAEGVELLKSRAEVDVKTGMKPLELMAIIGTGFKQFNALRADGIRNQNFGHGNLPVAKWELKRRRARTNLHSKPGITGDKL
jgi:hypothetical protein